MTVSLTRLLLDVLAGLLLGSLYFGGLWVTLRQLSHARHAGLGMAASLMLRLAMVAA